MKNCNTIFSVMFCMRQRGFTGSGKAEYGSYVFGTIRKRIFFLSTVTGSITITVCNRPCHGKSSFFMLSEVLHSKDSSAVLVCIEIAKSLIIAQAAVIYIRALGRFPLWIRENIDICFFAVTNHLGFFVHLYIFI